MPTLNDARILITGGNGFIGSHLANFIQEGHPEANIVIGDVEVDSPNPLLGTGSRAALLGLDVRDPANLKELVEKIEPTHVYHLAAFVNAGRDPELIDKAVEINIRGTLNLLRSLSGSPVESIVHLGTSEVYGDNEPPFAEDMSARPTSPYSISKVASEHFCHMFYKVHGLPLVCLRPFNVYGEGQGPGMMIPQVISTCLTNRGMDLTEGRQTREVNHAQDIVEGIVTASMTKSARGEIINLGSGLEISVRKLAERIKELSGSTSSLNFGALAYRDNEIWRMFCDNSKAQRILGWKPKIDLEEGLKRTIDWYRQNASGYESNKPWINLK